MLDERGIPFKNSSCIYTMDKPDAGSGAPMLDAQVSLSGSGWEKEEDGVFRQEFEMLGEEYESVVIPEEEDDATTLEHYIKHSGESGPLTGTLTRVKNRLSPGPSDIERHPVYDELENPHPDTYDDFDIPDSNIPGLKRRENNIIGHLGSSLTRAETTEGVAGFKVKVYHDQNFDVEKDARGELKNIDSAIEKVVELNYKAMR